MWDELSKTGVKLYLRNQRDWTNQFFWYEPHDELVWYYWEDYSLERIFSTSCLAKSKEEEIANVSLIAITLLLITVISGRFLFHNSGLDFSCKGAIWFSAKSTSSPCEWTSIYHNNTYAPKWYWSSSRFWTSTNIIVDRGKDISQYKIFRELFNNCFLSLFDRHQYEDNTWLQKFYQWNVISFRNFLGTFDQSTKVKILKTYLNGDLLINHYSSLISWNR